MLEYYIHEKILYLEGELLKKTIDSSYDNFTKTDLENFNKIDISKIENIDSFGVAFLDLMIEKISNNEKYEILQNVPPKFNDIIKTFSSLDLEDVQPVLTKTLFEKLGEIFFDFKNEFIESMFLTADIFYWSILGLFNPKGQRKGAVIQQGILIGVEAIPILSLLSLIIGLILALQSAAQLRQFGANIFVADLISISMVREMGPMMTAIIVAGRSGSAFASEIATMKVSEEIDALKMMSINPIKYIVAPKFQAISFCLPLLVILSIFVGIFGGLLIAIFYLDLTPISYINEAISILSFQDIFVSLIKSITFSWAIVIIGSYYGFQVKGGAEGVGKATTYSVVASIFTVIVLDVIFSLIFLPK
jgi:phospholipid/cholesterol/gamma-HCH transport system permease protein